jgi:hypothetical protein
MLDEAMGDALSSRWQTSDGVIKKVRRRFPDASYDDVGHLLGVWWDEDRVAQRHYESPTGVHGDQWRRLPKGAAARRGNPSEDIQGAYERARRWEKRAENAWRRIETGRYKGSRSEAYAKAEELDARVAKEWAAVEALERTNPSKRDEKRAAYAQYRDTVSRTKATDRKTRRKRDADLVEGRDACAVEHTLTKTKCRTRREKVRTTARKALAKAKARRDEALTGYQWRVGQARTRRWERVYTRSESDSLAEQNIPDRLLTIWRPMRAQFDYKRQPDDRAVLFLEWVGEHHDEVESELAASFEVDDSDWARLEAQHHRETGAPAVPF